MSTTKASLRLRMALMGTGLVVPVDGSDNIKNFHALCRQVPGQEREWLKVVEHLLVQLPASVPADTAEFFFARRYVLKDGKLAFGWYVGVTAKNVKQLEASVSVMAAELARFKPSLAAAAPEAPGPVEEEPVYRRPLPPGVHPGQVQRLRRPSAEELIPTDRQVPPKGFVPRLTTVKSSVDSKGHQEIIQEMPLPHVYSELNRPNAKGRGAKPLAGD